MYFKFWGTRGSIPVPGNNTLKYGGNTPCVEIRSNDNKIIILDAGSGIRELGKSLINNGYQNPIAVLFSHYHWDHIQGIPFFLPLFSKENDVTFYGETSYGEKIKDILSNQMSANYFPIKIDQVEAKTSFKEIEPNKDYNVAGIKFETFRANHSSPTISFKIKENDKTLVYLTDNELVMEDSDKKSIFEQLSKNNKDLIDFCSGCDYLIHDSMYDESTLSEKKGWGHSANKTLAYFGILSQVKNLILFHYNPDYTDNKIDLLLKETNDILKEENSGIKCIAAAEGLRIDC